MFGVRMIFRRSRFLWNWTFSTINVAKLKCEMDLKWERENVRWIMWNVKLNIIYHIYIKREMCDGKWSVNFNLKLEMGNLKTRMVTLKLNCNIEIEILYWNWIMKMDMKWEMWIWLCNVTLERWNLKLDKYGFLDINFEIGKMKFEVGHGF